MELQTLTNTIRRLFARQQLILGQLLLLKAQQDLQGQQALRVHLAQPEAQVRLDHLGLQEVQAQQGLPEVRGHLGQTGHLGQQGLQDLQAPPDLRVLTVLMDRQAPQAQQAPPELAVLLVQQDQRDLAAQPDQRALPEVRDQQDLQALKVM